MVAPISLIAATDSCGRALHARDVRGNLVGRLRGLARQRLHFARDHRKAAAGLAGARRLDGGVERQQIGLLGNRRDQLDHVADLLGGMRQFADAAVGLLGLHDGGFGDAAGVADLAADLLDRGRQLFRRGRDRLHVAGGLLGYAGDLARQGSAWSRRCGSAWTPRIRAARRRPRRSTRWRRRRSRNHRQSGSARRGGLRPAPCSGLRWRRHRARPWRRPEP